MRLIACLLAAALAVASEPSDPAEALRLPASGPELTTAAKAWEADALLALFSDADPARRRGAARLASALPVPAPRLLAAVIASDDREVRRLGANGLRGQDLPPAELARLPDADVLAALVAEHPAEDPLADAALGRLVEGWISDPQRCLHAARLIAMRGTAARWGETLLKALAHADPGVVVAAHDALQALTRSQRSLDAYAGDRRLLAQDWRDILAAKPALTRPDPELMALVADLPAGDAVSALLARGPAALPAIERAQAAATRARRRELEPVARLIAHGVPPGLYAALGAAAFTDLDDADPARRMACLRKLVAEIRTRADAAGLALLICALDDEDSAVRATALDQLIRLSDDSESFKKEWRIEPEALFQPEHTVRRLRRSLRDGAPDEQIAALLLVGSLAAKQLSEDVLPLVMSPRDDVVGTALETLKQIGPNAKQIPLLARLTADPGLPADRRIAAATVLGKIMDNDARGGGAAALAPLIRLVEDPEPRVATAAVQALVEGDAKGPVLRKALDRMVQRGMAKAAIDIADERNEPELIALLVSRVTAAAADADHAAIALAEGTFGWNDDRRKAIRLAIAAPDLGAALATSPLPGHAALARVAGTIDTGTALGRLGGDDADLRDRTLSILAKQAVQIEELAAVATALRDAPPTARRAVHAVEQRILALAARTPDRLAVVATTAKDLLDVTDNSSTSANGKMVRTLTLRDGSKLVLEAKSTDPEDGYFDHDDLPWTLVGPLPTGGLDAAGLQNLTTLLAGLPPGDEDDRADRALAIAWIGNSEPAPVLAKRWANEDDLCRLLSTSWPAFRVAVVDRIIADSAPGRGSLWQLRQWLKVDPERLAPLALQMLVAEERISDYEAKPVLQAIAALPADRIADLMPMILAKPDLAKLADELRAASGPLLLDAALALAEHGSLGEHAIRRPLPDDASERIFLRLALWNPAQVLARTASVRRLRAADAKAIDLALERLVARADPAAAAWLRSGIPIEAGMLESYRKAESSTIPELALVGSAFALKEGRLRPDAFLARIGAWPSPVQIDAAAAAQRYCDGTWDTLGDPAGMVVKSLAVRALPAWIAVLPGSEPVVAALAQRVADPATAESIGVALAQRQSRDPAWKSAAATIAAQAHGRLDWLGK